LVVDDHSMFAESIARMLAREADLLVVGVAASATEGIALAKRLTPDVAIVDYQLPDAEGPDAAVRIRAASAATAVIILTGLGSDRAAASTVTAGCAGFLTKDRAVDELVAAVRTVSTGGVHLPASVLADLAPRLRPGYRPIGADLTKREAEILQLFVDGLSTQAIADRLVVSVNTVRNHVQRLLAKLGVHSKLEAVALAAREGLLDTAR
jgi:DNA-binding NarL/FixJ family response regulator